VNYLEAESWAASHGLTVDLSIHRSATHPQAFDINAAYCALIADLKRQSEDLPVDLPVDPPSVPPAHVASTRRALAAEIRDLVERMERLRAGCVELAEHNGARIVFRMQSDLSALAGELGS